MNADIHGLPSPKRLHAGRMGTDEEVPVRATKVGVCIGRMAFMTRHDIRVYPFSFVSIRVSNFTLANKLKRDLLQPDSIVY